MLVDQHDTDVLALGGEALEGGLDGRRVRLAVYHEEVLLRVRRVRDVLFRCVSKSVLPALRRGGMWGVPLHRCLRAVDPLLSPKGRGEVRHYAVSYALNLS